MLAPFHARTISSPYGWRVHPDRAQRQFHHAIDYRVPAGAAVRSIAPGVVRRAHADPKFGNVVEIDHGAGYVSRYCHLRSISVTLLDYVDSEATIGAVGSTGTSARGAHLHLELWHHGRHIDPRPALAERS